MSTDISLTDYLTDQAKKYSFIIDDTQVKKAQDLFSSALFAHTCRKTFRYLEGACVGLSLGGMAAAGYYKKPYIATALALTAIGAAALAIYSIYSESKRDTAVKNALLVNASSPVEDPKALFKALRKIASLEESISEVKKALEGKLPEDVTDKLNMTLDFELDEKTFDAFKDKNTGISESVWDQLDENHINDLLSRDSKDELLKLVQLQSVLHELESVDIEELKKDTLDGIDNDYKKHFQAWINELSQESIANILIDRENAELEKNCKTSLASKWLEIVENHLTRCTEAQKKHLMGLVKIFADEEDISYLRHVDKANLMTLLKCSDYSIYSEHKRRASVADPRALRGDLLKLPSQDALCKKNDRKITLDFDLEEPTFEALKEKNIHIRNQVWDQVSKNLINFCLENGPGMHSSIQEHVQNYSLFLDFDNSDIEVFKTAILDSIDQDYRNDFIPWINTFTKENIQEALKSFYMSDIYNNYNEARERIALKIIEKYLTGCTDDRKSQLMQSVEPFIKENSDRLPYLIENEFENIIAILEHPAEDTDPLIRTYQASGMPPAKLLELATKADNHQAMLLSLLLLDKDTRKASAANALATLPAAKSHSQEELEIEYDILPNQPFSINDYKLMRWIKDTDDRFETAANMRDIAVNTFGSARKWHIARQVTRYLSLSTTILSAGAAGFALYKSKKPYALVAGLIAAVCIGIFLIMRDQEARKTHKLKTLLEDNPFPGLRKQLEDNVRHFDDSSTVDRHIIYPDYFFNEGLDKAREEFKNQFTIKSASEFLTQNHIQQYKNAVKADANLSDRDWHRLETAIDMLDRDTLAKLVLENNGLYLDVVKANNYQQKIAVDQITKDLSFEASEAVKRVLIPAVVSKDDLRKDEIAKFAYLQTLFDACQESGLSTRELAKDAVKWENKDALTLALLLTEPAKRNELIEEVWNNASEKIQKKLFKSLEEKRTLSNDFIEKLMDNASKDMQKKLRDLLKEETGPLPDYLSLNTSHLTIRPVEINMFADKAEEPDIQKTLHDHFSNRPATLSNWKQYLFGSVAVLSGAGAALSLMKLGKQTKALSKIYEKVGSRNIAIAFAVMAIGAAFFWRREIIRKILLKQQLIKSINVGPEDFQMNRRFKKQFKRNREKLPEKVKNYDPETASIHSVIDQAVAAYGKNLSPSDQTMIRSLLLSHPTQVKKLATANIKKNLEDFNMLKAFAAIDQYDDPNASIAEKAKRFAEVSNTNKLSTGEYLLLLSQPKDEMLKMLKLAYPQLKNFTSSFQYAKALTKGIDEFSIEKLPEEAQKELINTILQNIEETIRTTDLTNIENQLQSQGHIGQLQGLISQKMIKPAEIPDYEDAALDLVEPTATDRIVNALEKRHVKDPMKIIRLLGFANPHKKYETDWNGNAQENSSNKQFYYKDRECTELKQFKAKKLYTACKENAGQMSKRSAKTIARWTRGNSSGG